MKKLYTTQSCNWDIWKEIFQTYTGSSFLLFNKKNKPKFYLRKALFELAVLQS